MWEATTLSALPDLTLFWGGGPLGRWVRGGSKAACWSPRGVSCVGQAHFTEGGEGPVCLGSHKSSQADRKCASVEVPTS